MATPLPEPLFQMPNTPTPFEKQRFIGANCPEQYFSEKAVSSAVSKLRSLTLTSTPAARPKDGMNIYPSPIWPNTKDDEIFNSEQWKGCQRDQPDTSYVQFPIFANGTQYEGGPSGQEFIIALVHGQKAPYSSFVYCGVMSRRGKQNKKSSALCDLATKTV